MELSWSKGSAAPRLLVIRTKLTYHHLRPAQCRTQDAIEPLEKYNAKIWVVPTIINEVSVRQPSAFLLAIDTDQAYQSTRVRAQIQNGERVEDIPDSVYKYIKLHHLYQKEPMANGRHAEITNGN